MKNRKLYSSVSVRNLFLLVSIGLWAAAVFAGCSGATAPADGYSGSPGVSGSGSDLYFEYSSKTTGATMTIIGHSKMFFSAAGKIRAENSISNTAKPDSSPSIMLGSFDKPTETIDLDDAKKTWTVNHIDSSFLTNSGIKIQSSVSKIGEETIQGFKCVHARVISRKSIAGMDQGLDTVDIWKSADVPTLAGLTKYMDRFGSVMGLMFDKTAGGQMIQMGCEGLLVRMDMRNKDIFSHAELTKMEKRDIPQSLFEIPSGYTQDKNGF